MSGIFLPLMTGFAYVPHLSFLASITTPSAAGTIECGVSFKGGGILAEVKGDPMAPVETNRPGEWCIPQGIFGGPFFPGLYFDLFASLASGTLSQGAAFLDVWTPLDVFSPFFAVERTGVGFESATLTFAIRNRVSLQTVTFGTYELAVV